MRGRAGTLKTNLSGEAAYRSFVPAPLPPWPALKLNAETLDMLVRANKGLAVLETISSRIPNIPLFIAMYVRKEALLSSQIEGTQATLEDILDPLIDENANRDAAEVINYIRAVEFALKRRKKLPLCNRLIREIHAVLLAGGRGNAKAPGEFRRSQNWIGPQGSSLKNARFIPPNPGDMKEALSALETYMNAGDDLDVLVRAALVHYQFETIHPFLDGNGRMGRLLTILFLIEKGVLSTPALYISWFLKQNRIEYYDRLTEVRNKGSYEQWVLFFLRAMAASAAEAVKAIDRLTALHHKNLRLIGGMGRAAKTAGRLFDYLEANPIIDIQKTATALATTFATVSGAVDRLCAAGILVKTTGASRNRLFSYRAYLDILREGT